MLADCAERIVGAAAECTGSVCAGRQRKRSETDLQRFNKNEARLTLNAMCCDVTVSEAECAVLESRRCSDGYTLIVVLEGCATVRPIEEVQMAKSHHRLTTDDVCKLTEKRIFLCVFEVVDVQVVYATWHGAFGGA